MAVFRQVCPFHADKDIPGGAVGSNDGSIAYTCPRVTGHPHPGPHSWLEIPQPRGLPGIDSYAAELGLDSELQAAIGQYKGRWLEYGVVERAYALRRPEDFAAIVSRYGHKALEPKQYTASAFLAGVLAALSRHGTILYHLGPATGRWSYNEKISWWSVAPAPDWNSARLSWVDSGDDTSYIPALTVRNRISDLVAAKSAMRAEQIAESVFIVFEGSLVAAECRSAGYGGSDVPILERRDQQPSPCNLVFAFCLDQPLGVIGQLSPVLAASTRDAVTGRSRCRPSYRQQRAALGDLDRVCTRQPARSLLPPSHLHGGDEKVGHAI